MDSLDTFFLETLDTIQKAYLKLPRFLQIRIENWCTKLSEENIHDEWKKNRNHYALYLLQCIQSKEFKEPFHQKPTGEPLGKLPSYIILSLPKVSVSSSLVSSLPLLHPRPTRTKKISNSEETENTKPLETVPVLSQPPQHSSHRITSRPRQVTRWDPIISNVIGSSTYTTASTENTQRSVPSIYANILQPTYPTDNSSPSNIPIPPPPPPIPPVSRGRETTVRHRHHSNQKFSNNPPPSFSHQHRHGIMFHPRNPGVQTQTRSYSDARQPSIHSSLSPSSSSSNGWRDDSFDASSITSSVVSRHERDASYLRSDKEEMDRRVRIAAESRQSSLSSQRSKVRFANNATDSATVTDKTGIERALIDAQEKMNQLQRELHHTKKQLRIAQEELRRSYHQRETNEKRIYQLDTQVQQLQTQIQSLTTYILELRTENQSLQQQYTDTVTRTQAQHEQDLSQLKQKYTDQINILKQQIGNKFLKWVINKENTSKGKEIEELFSNIHFTAEEEKYIDEDDDIVYIPQSGPKVTLPKESTRKIKSLSSVSARIRKENKSAPENNNSKELEILLGGQSLGASSEESVEPVVSSSTASFTSPLAERIGTGNSDNIKKDDSPVSPLTFFSSSPPPNELLVHPYPVSTSPLIPGLRRGIESFTENSEHMRIGRSSSTKITKMEPTTTNERSKSSSTSSSSTVSNYVPAPILTESVPSQLSSSTGDSKRKGSSTSVKSVLNKTKPMKGKELPPRPSIYTVFPLEKVLPYPYSSLPPSGTTNPSTSVLVSPTISDTSFLSTTSTIFTSTSNDNTTSGTDNHGGNTKKPKHRWSGQLANSKENGKDNKQTSVTTTTTITSPATIPIFIGKETSGTSTIATITSNSSSNTNTTRSSSSSNPSNNNAFGYETNPAWNEPIIPLQIPFKIPNGLR